MTRDETFALALATLYATGVLLTELETHDVIAVPVVVVALTFVPGILLMLSLDVFRPTLRHLVYSIGLSLMVLIVLGVAENLFLPLVGVEEPLTRPPLLATVTLYVVGLTVYMGWRGTTSKISLPLPTVDSPHPLIFLLLPFLSIIAINVLNATGENTPLLAVLTVCALVPLYVVLVVPQRWHSLGIWTLALSILYHKTLWKFASFSGSGGGIRAWEAGRWTPGLKEVKPTTTDLLENGILHPTYAEIAGLNIITVYEVVGPFLVSFLPVVLFLTFRRYTTSKTAFLGASLFTFAHPFYLQYPWAGRASIPVLFLALVGLVLSDVDLPSLPTSGLSIVFITGIIVSHYGTSYFVIFLLMFSLGILTSLRYIEREAADGVLRTVTDWIGRPLFDDSQGANSSLTWTLTLFHSVGAVAWYMYAKSGESLSLFNHIAAVMTQFLSGSFFAGRTTNRIQKSYGAEAIKYSKYVYAVLGLLMAFGIVAMWYNQILSSNDDVFDREYLTLGTSVLGVFSTTILFRTWGGGRPMMITFVFTAIFAVVGLQSFARVVQVRTDSALSSVVVPYDASRYRTAFGMLLAVVLLLNTGVASALFIGGFAPTNVPLQEQLDESDNPEFAMAQYKSTDIQTHVWIIAHYDGESNAYGGKFVKGSADWYNPEINVQTAGLYTYGNWVPRGNVDSLARPGIENGYVVLLGHNQELGMMSNAIENPSDRRRFELSELESELDQRNRIYSTGRSSIYYYSNRSTESAS